MRKKFIIASIGAAAIAVVLAWPRSMHTYYASRVVTPCLAAQGGREHWATPNCEGMGRVGDHEAMMRFNSDGIRDREYGERLSKSSNRILMLGSSNIVGIGFPEADTVPRKLERYLRGRGYEVEVINAAMPGYCTIQSNFRLRKLLEKYRPDYVVYHLVLGNCVLFDGAWQDRLVTENGAPAYFDRAPFPAFLVSGNQFMFDHLSFFFFWLTAADQLKKASFSWHTYLHSSDEASRAEYYLAPTLRALEYMRSELAKSKGELVLVSHEMKPILQSIPMQMHAWLSHLLSVLIKNPGISIATMVDSIRKSGFTLFHFNVGRSEMFVLGDEHFNDEGLQRLAKATGDALIPRLKGPHAKPKRGNFRSGL